MDFGWTRRTLLSSAAAALAVPALAQVSRPARRSRLILLGTKGGPTPSKLRAPNANLLIVDGKPYLIDCPDGVSRQLVLAGVDPYQVEHVFLTHLHSDHMAGLAALYQLAWGTGLKKPMTTYGPPALHQVVKAAMEFAGPDIDYRVEEEGRPDLRKLIRSREVAGGETVIDQPPIKVTSARTDHYKVPSLAYRFDTPDRSFVFSGDTAPSDALIELARGADVLVHEVLYEDVLDRITDPNAPNLRDHLVKSHTSTEQLGRVAAAAGVKTLVLSHLVPTYPEITDEMWTAKVRRHFKGEIVVGRDLMEI